MPDQQQAVASPPPAPQRVVMVPAKSMGLAIFLAVFFGPLGLLYSSVKGAVIMFFVNLVVGVVTVGLGLVLCWPLCGIWAYLATKSYNEKLLQGR